MKATMQHGLMRHRMMMLIIIVALMAGLVVVIRGDASFSGDSSLARGSIAIRGVGGTPAKDGQQFLRVAQPPSLTNAPVAQWREVGLPNLLVHGLALGHADFALAFAATSRGVYRRDHDLTWRHVLASGDVWGIMLLSDDKTVIAADNAGDLDMSNDAGSQWHRIAINPQGVFAVTTQPGRGRRILAGAADGLYLSDDGGTHWQHRLVLKASAVTALAWQPGSTHDVLAGAVAGTLGGSTAVYISHDSGMTWAIFGRDLQSGGGLMSLTVVPNGGVFAGTMGNAVWTASAASSGTPPAWHKSAVGMPATGDHVAALISIPDKPHTLFAATEGYGVYRTTDGGAYWIGTSLGLPASRYATLVLSLVYSPREQALYAGTGNGVYEWRFSTQ